MSIPLRIYTSTACSNLAQEFSVPSTVICRKEAWTPDLDHVYREVFCRPGSTLGPGFITMKPKISRLVTNKGSRQGKMLRQNLDEAYLKRRYHTGWAAIENANTIEERRSNIVRNIVFDCHLTPHCRQNGNRNYCFYRFLIRVRRLLIAFSIAAYLVWL